MRTTADADLGIRCETESLLKRAEHTIQRLRRTHAMLGRIRALCAAAKGRDAFLAATCRIVVDVGGLPLCSIARLERSTETLVPVASAGGRSERQPSLAARCAETMTPFGVEEALSAPVSQVIAEKQIVICADALSALLPLVVADELVAIVLLSANDAEGFGQGDLPLLAELAQEIAFGIDYQAKVDRLHQLTYYDSITGLANRQLFLERAAQYLQNARVDGRRVALCLFDIERFKHVNDSLGRPAGDALLKQVGTWLSRRFGNANRVARVGVDHFGVLLPSITCEGAAVDAVEKELDAFVQQPFRLQDSMFRIAAKAGISVFPDDGLDPEVLYRHAEAALDEAKTGGDRWVRYRKQMSTVVADRLNLETRLRQALERGEFLLHYQPKLSLRDGGLTGAEALIRWMDPQSGLLVPPARFVPILEETGLINDVGWWALRQAVADCRRWRSAGFAPVRIAVNVSPLQLRHPGFVPAAWRAVTNEGMSPGDLELEITESVIMDGIQQGIRVLQAIREMGVRITIDDFGTGFSSLSYLSRLPVDTLKIDRSFVVDMTAGPQGLSLVSTIINLAHSLKLKVVAEGVETEEQSRLLRLLGCDEMQGHLCSEAVPAAVFESRFLQQPSSQEIPPAPACSD